MLISIDTKALRGTDPAFLSTASISVSGRLFPLRTVVRTAYELLGRWDIEIHPRNGGWMIECARAHETPFFRPLDEVDAQTAAEWEIGSQLVTSGVDEYFYTANTPLREGLVATAFNISSVEVWEVFRQCGNNHTVAGPGAEIAQVVNAGIVLTEAMDYLPHIMLACRQLLDRCLLRMGLNSEGEIHVDLRPTDENQSLKCLREELCARLNSKYAQVVPGDAR